MRHDSRRRDSSMGGLDDRISTARPRIGRRSQQTVAEGGRKGWRKPRAGRVATKNRRYWAASRLRQLGDDHCLAVLCDLRRLCKILY